MKKDLRELTYKELENRLRNNRRQIMRSRDREEKWRILCENKEINEEMNRKIKTELNTLKQRKNGVNM